MKQTRRTAVAVVGTVALALLICGTAAAAGPNAGGILGCGGTSIVLSGGTEGNDVYTIYQFVNFNDNTNISIDRMVVYADGGNAVCDFPGVNAFPTGLNSSLGPHASTAVTTLSMSCLPPPTYPAGNLSVVVYWSFAGHGRGMPLNGRATEQVLDNASFQHLGRSSVACTELNPK